MLKILVIATVVSTIIGIAEDGLSKGWYTPSSLYYMHPSPTSATSPSFTDTSSSLLLRFLKHTPAI